MDQREIERFQVIGACTGMQTISWDEECKLMDGVLYEIDFFQDFSGMLKDGEPALVVDARIVMQPTAKTVDMATEERQRALELFKQADKCVRQERKREEKWKRKQKRDGRNNRERQVDAELFFEYIDEWANSK